MAFVEPLEYSCFVPVMGIIWALLRAALVERFLSFYLQCQKRGFL